MKDLTDCLTEAVKRNSAEMKEYLDRRIQHKVLGPEIEGHKASLRESVEDELRKSGLDPSWYHFEIEVVVSAVLRRVGTPSPSATVEIMRRP